MILEIGDQPLDFGDKSLKIMFPLLVGTQQLLVSTTIETLAEDDMLSSYSCGDMLNDIGQLMASTKCTEAASHKISMSVFMQSKDESNSKVGHCSAMACQKHAFMGMMETTFISGIISAYRMEDDKKKREDILLIIRK